MQMAEATGWAVLAALVAIPLCYYFWKRWDRPTSAAKREQERRLEEREVRLIFLKEEAKSREAERGQSLVSLEQRKKHDAMPPSTETLSMALSSIDDKPIPAGEGGSEGSGIPGVTSEVVAEARSAAEIAELESIPDSIEVPYIEPDESVPDILEDEGPIVLKVTIDLPEEVKAQQSAEVQKSDETRQAAKSEKSDEVKPTHAETKDVDEEVDWPEWE
jgi:hypothetical protein